MPVVNFHLAEGQSSTKQHEQLLRESCLLYCEVLKAPMDRVRAFITSHTASQFTVAGDITRGTGLNHAPYFEFIVLDGRPLEERQRLLSGFTELLVNIMKVRRELVRGCCRRVDPEDWAIGGVSASVLRKEEISMRAEAAALSVNK